MKYPSLYISGNIINYELIEKLEQDNYAGQSTKDFKIEKGARLRDEIGKAWTDANDYWRIFNRKTEQLKDSDRGTSETRNLWIVPFMELLGYHLAYQQQPEAVGEKSFDISHRATNLDGFPIMVASFKDSLDKRPEGQTRYRMSAHAVVQEYLNLTEHAYGLVTNGYSIRLLRDSGRISRLSYVEFDLRQIFEESLYPDFVILYRLLHSSRMPVRKEEASESWIEKYHQESLAEGGRIREHLSESVEKAIKEFGRQLLAEPQNTALREDAAGGSLSAHKLYGELLNLIYRLLFIMVIEERRLVFGEKPDADTARLRDIYYRFYSLSRLRGLVDKRMVVLGHKHDIWQMVLRVFSIYEEPRYARSFGLQALGSDLFKRDALYNIRRCTLSNKALLDTFYNLSYFFDKEKKTSLRVNYGALNVEEFGSVYEGLLEYEPDLVQDVANGTWSFGFKHSQGASERSKSGSHYTPEELVQPLIKHSLDYLLEDRIKLCREAVSKNKWTGSDHKTKRQKLAEEHILSLKVADVACGSGHILISAARRIAEVMAAFVEEEEQPNPTAYRKAKREVIKHCIYGVDKNPLAVDLCKVALWLEAHNPGEPLNFLDHHIKCGDGIVGLAHKEEMENGIADEAFKTLPGDEKEIASLFAKRNKQERKQKDQLTLDLVAKVNDEVNTMVQKYSYFENLPEASLEDIAQKERAYRNYETSGEYLRLKQLADTQVAQFFIPKTDGNKDFILTDSEYRKLLGRVNAGVGALQDRRLSYAEMLQQDKRFFHWFIEFPDVFEHGGFDCVVGNPPYLGDKKQKKAFGDNFLEYIKYRYSVGINDLVVYFFNRIYSLINNQKYQALITTSSISQGDMRSGALDNIQKNSGNIIYAIKSLKWPGVANLNVALLVIKKGGVESETIKLNGNEVNYISSFLTAEIQIGEPVEIKENENRIFTGYYFLGDGFLLTNEKAREIIDINPIYKDVVLPFINGDDLNDSVDQSPSRSIINFYDWPLDEAYDHSLKVPRGKPYAIDYPICLEIVENLVKPERQRWKIDKNGNEIVGEYALRKPLPERWWIYGENRPGMRNAIKDLRHFFATAQTTKYLNFIKLDSTIAVSQTAFVYSSEEYSGFIILQSSLHYEWSVKYGNSKGDTFRYAPSKTFETFPFPQYLIPQQKSKLEIIGEAYHEYRKELMLQIQLGLTKTYNAFHAKEVKNGIHSGDLEKLDKKTIEKQYAKEVWNLWNHLQKTPGTCSIEDAIAGILKLRELHVEMDNAVLEAYGWSDIALKHDFYEVDYLPENDRIRYTIHPEARKEVLKRLLELNHKINEEEVKAGLWNKKKSGSKKKSEVADEEDEVKDLFNS